MIDYCDTIQDDDIVCLAEIRECLVMAENAWREEMYPDFGYLYCDVGTCPHCEGAWSCEYIME